MKHNERLRACIEGREVDRPPMALWRHFPVDDMKAETMAQAHLAFQSLYDFDLVKVTPPSGYFLYDWGLQDVWQGNMEGTRTYTIRIIHSPDDWEKLPDIDLNSGYLGEYLESLRIIRKELSADTPMVMTIFNPLSNAKKLVGDEIIFEHMRSYPEKLQIGLEKITQLAKAYIQAVKEIGVDGIFFAVQHASYDLVTMEEYLKFCRYYDLDVLDSAADLWLNILHLHGQNVMFEQVADYPVSVINWHDLETEPNLSMGKEIFSGAVCGGLKQWDTMTLGTAGQIREEAFRAIELTGGNRFILGTGCVVHVVAPHGNIMAARNSVED